MFLKRFWLFTLTATACYSDVLTPEKMRADYARLVPSPKADVHAFYQLAQAYTQEMEKAPWGTPQACNYRDTLYAMFTQGHGWWGGFSKTTVANTQEKHMGLKALLALSARTPKAQADAVQAQIQREAPGSLVRGHYSLVHEVLSAGWTVLNTQVPLPQSTLSSFASLGSVSPADWAKTQRQYVAKRVLENYVPSETVQRGIELFGQGVIDGFNEPIVSLLKDIPSDQWDALINKALAFITPGMDQNRRRDAIEAAMSVPDEDWPTYISYVNRLADAFRGHSDEGEDYNKHLFMVMSIPYTQLMFVVDQILHMPPPYRDPENYYYFFNRLKGIADTNQWVARVQRLVANIDLPGDDHYYTERVYQILETDLDHPILPLHGGMAAVAAAPGGYAHGINVHAMGRDDKTSQAYRLLKVAQTGLTPQTIGDAYSDFSKVLDTQSEPLKSRIKIALGLEPSTSGFGPLLAGTITTCGLNMSGEELIGRLWHFVNTYQDSRATSASQESAEQENARQSVFAGLSSALEDDGHVVCNPGKLQRLAVSVLQGRLQGVNIDDVPLERASSGGASAAASSAKVPTPTETTELVQGAWERYKESHTGGPLTHADVEAFGRQFIADNPHYHKGAFEGVMEYLRAHETDE